MNVARHFRELLDTDTPFALLHRPTVRDEVELLSGRVEHVAGTDDLRRLSATHTVFAALPARTARERGLDVWQDDAPLAAMCVDSRVDVDSQVLVEMIGPTPAPIASGAFDEDDSQYADRVRRLIREEIGRGEGANFVLERRWSGTMSEADHRSMLALFRRLFEAERGAYWTYLYWTGEGYLLGSSPERHISLHDGEIAMSPISGTLRHEGAPSIDVVRRFLEDSKEDDELCMVLDEELKVVNALCEGRVAVEGPVLRQMARVSHTEYRIAGRSEALSATVLRHSLAAPTVVGSPLRNAAAVVARHEGRGRRYYSGVLALFEGPRELDSAIIIRTAEIGLDRSVTIGAGATVTRSSDPAEEAMETSAKAASLLAALEGSGTRQVRVGDCAAQVGSEWPVDDEGSMALVDQLLTARNDRLAPFWFIGTAPVRLPGVPSVHIVDAEDDFTAMLARQLESLGASVTRSSWRDSGPDQVDLLVLGPGPGDPRDLHDDRVTALHDRATEALLNRQPLLAVCLGHQVVARRLGMEIRRQTEAGQGRQSVIDHFGQRIRVGYYNSFSVHSPVDWFRSTFAAGEVRVARNPYDGTVHGLRGARLETFQFHPESILSPDGLAAVRAAVCRLTAASVERRLRVSA